MWTRGCTRALVSVAVALAATALSAAGVARAAPAATTTRYMTTTDRAALFQEGCAQTDETGIVILDFGQPWWDGTSFGTILFGANTFRSVADIEAAVEGWLDGYWSCGGIGSARLAIGTSNFRGFTQRAHGAAWAGLVTRVNDWILAPPSWGARLAARGASDLEPSWNTAANSRAWVDGYTSVFQYPFYNYGSADGCPPFGSCNNGWTQEDVWYVAYGAASAWPIPEIYSPANAQQWYRIGQYGAVHHGSAVHFLGTLTQRAAAGGCCTNAPDQGWQQLFEALNGNPQTAQDLPYSTDITWAN
jgi:hypothetical protein